MEGGPTTPAEWIVRLEELPMQAQQVFIAVDVAKDNLVISIGGTPKPQVVGNDAPAINV